MQKMGIEDFADRIHALQRAREIFIKTGLTNNISKAFEAYQEILSDTERDIVLHSPQHGNRNRTKLDGFQRPSCPLCKSDIMFRTVHGVPNGTKTQLLCSNKICDGLWNSQQPIAYWIQLVKSGSLDIIKFNDMVRGSKKDKRPGDKVQSHQLLSLCPKCNNQTLYAISPCCGASYGMVECNYAGCSFMQPLNEKLRGNL